MINRINARKYLNDIYAPGGKAGVYYVLSEFVSVYSGYWTVVGHVLLVNGKPKRCWMES